MVHRDNASTGQSRQKSGQWINRCEGIANQLTDTISKNFCYVNNRG
ncbi:hypothetical protein ALO42_101487 [Pseudomonas syringae pv. atrofaciens]|uniref:Uncharacterized protein n=3 Tax=Pseudomonas syringae group TaxID=136849 RepID=A0A0Q0FP48_PSEAP|nr:hypothetical protein ALO42_101487 [Pseudomonas syringae pv. atrofaciens]KPX61181.1 hypothetical protein ALO39_101175 [Pseudomonas syringae pv. lapsa]KPY69561.1 hypothetical protein ALO45_101102 [Pseudomonas syringae pv. syringae]KPZ02234.1 hypothetical protein ALO85_100969 [Pseudomonas syringae pv. aptata]RMM25393.1 hypothetical protein ALQ81_101166 [Pseudomonas syringae pv. pisi]RMN70113.1 hypothetical protein ALQ54_100887 [Pseudomonas syringae]RMR93024.1 hypothetical protein ALP78_101271